MDIRAFLDHTGALVEGIKCMDDAVKRVASMAQVASDVPAVPAVSVT